jgi:hypothetical protein
MRANHRGQAAFDEEVEDLAAQWNVKLWLWHLFGKDSDYRAHTVPAAPSRPSSPIEGDAT